MKLFTAVAGATLSILSTPLFAQASAGAESQVNDTMLALLVSGRKLVIESADYRIEVVFSKDGAYKTSNGSSGSWTMQGERLCTVTQEGIRSCGRLPSNRRLNDRWSTSDYEKRPATVSIQ